VSPGFLERLVDRMHAVIAADREEVGIAAVHFIEQLHELDVRRSVALVVVMPRGNQAEAGIAHRLERLLRRRLARSQPLGLGKSIPRSANALPKAAGCAPPGMKMKMHSGFMSLARCTKAEKSGFATGNRTDPMISPPASLKARWNAASESCP